MARQGLALSIFFTPPLRRGNNFHSWWYRRAAMRGSSENPVLGEKGTGLPGWIFLVRIRLTNALPRGGYELSHLLVGASQRQDHSPKSPLSRWVNGSDSILGNL